MAGPNREIRSNGAPRRARPAPGRGAPQGLRRPRQVAADGRGARGRAPGRPGGPPGRGGGRGWGRGDEPRKRSILWRMRRPLFLVALAMLAALAGVGVVVAQTELPQIEPPEQASFICASDVKQGKCNPNNAMTRLQGDEGNRTNVTLDQVPDIVEQAVLAVEDRDFYEHDGVNPEGIVRAMFQNAKAGSVQQGGSTITQQYVLNSFALSRQGGISRKLKEAVLSIKLEQEMSKDEILEGYLNTIYFGRGAYGVAAASRAYFGKDITDLKDPGKAALLAGLIRAPNLAEPTEYPEEATRRRHTALVAMKEEGYVTEDEATLADAVAMEKPWVRPVSTTRKIDTLRGASKDPAKYMGTDYLASYIRDELRSIDPDRFTDEVIEGGGLRVYTSLDYEMQHAAWTAVTSVLPNEDNPDTPEWEGDPEAAMVAVDDKGMIRAMVGSRHQFKPGKSETNLADRRFQTGSTFKPLVLAQSLIEGNSLRSRYDAPAKIEVPEFPLEDGTPWTPANYDDTENSGVMDLIEATRQSSNTAYVQLMLDLGIEYLEVTDDAGQPVLDDAGNPVKAPEGPHNVAELAESMGYGGEDGIAYDRRTPSMTLGTVEATPVEMAGVYSTFMNRGVHKQPDMITRVEQVDDDGKVTVLYERQVDEERIMPESTADLVNHTLQQVLQPGATGANANLGKPAAGKTGTAQDNRDAWFAGYVPGLTATVWMGYPEAEFDDDGDPSTQKVRWPMNDTGRPVQGRSATGGSFPAEIWRTFMEVAAADLTGEFVAVTPEQIEAGTVLNEGELLLPSETLPPRRGDDGDGEGDGEDDRPGNGGGGGDGGGGPRWSVPETTQPTTEPAPSTTTTAQDTTTTSESGEPLPIPTEPGPGNSP